jgi:TetR/AcrR family transcriptional regulator, repressor for uid operon
MPRISEGRRGERRQSLIDAAWRCAAREGYHSVTVDDVCLEAGVSKGMFYGYFSSKQALLLALLEEDAGLIDSLIGSLADGTVRGVDRLRRFAQAMLKHGEDPARVQVRADLWASMLTTLEVRDQFATVVRRRRELLRSSIEQSFHPADLRGVAPRALASIVIALADGLTLHGALDPAGFRWSNVRRAIDVLLLCFTTPEADPLAGDGS